MAGKRSATIGREIKKGLLRAKATWESRREEIETERKRIRNETLEKLATLLTAAFGLVAALAWNSAIQAAFEAHPLLKQQGLWVYAATVTIIAVIVTVWLGRLTALVKKAGKRNA